MKISRSFRPGLRRGLPRCLGLLVCLSAVLVFSRSTPGYDDPPPNASDALKDFNRLVTLPSIPARAEALKPAADANEARYLCQLALESTFGRANLSQPVVLNLIRRINTSSLNSDLERLFGSVQDLQNARESAAQSISAASRSYDARQKERNDARVQARLQAIRDQNAEIDKKTGEAAQKLWDDSKTWKEGLLKAGGMGVLGNLAKTSESEAYKAAYRGMDSDLSADQRREISEIEQRRDQTTSTLNRQIVSLVSKISSAESLGDFDTEPPTMSGISDETAQKLFRNPFALAGVLSRVQMSNSEDGQICARVYLRCAELCPANSLYDGDRRTYLCDAAYCMTEAAVSAAPTATSYRGARTQTSTDATTLWEMASKSGEGQLAAVWNYNRGRALALDGQFAEAFEAMNAAANSYNDDPAFALRFAKVLSLSGRTNDSLSWLKHAVQLESSDLSNIRKCADFDALRQALQSDFEDATTVKSTWSKSLGWVWDEVKLTNNSGFKLTNVTLKVKITGTDGTWTQDLFVSSLDPGDTKSWDLGFKGITVRDDISEESAFVSCDQNK